MPAARKQRATVPALPGPAAQAAAQGAATRTGTGGTTGIPCASIPPAQRSAVLSPAAAATAAALAAAAATSAVAASAAAAADEASQSDEDGAGAEMGASRFDCDVTSSTGKRRSFSRREADIVKKQDRCPPFTAYDPSKVNLENNFAFTAFS